MIAPSLPYLDKTRLKSGKVIYYARRHRKGARIRLPDNPAAPDFMKAYVAAIETLSQETSPHKKKRADKHLVGWLINAYLDSSDYKALAHNTQRQRQLNLKRIRKTYANTPFDKITRQQIRLDKEAMQDRENAANAYIIVWRALIKWAKKMEYVTKDPTAGIELFAREKDGGHLPWKDEDIQAFETAWPVGSMQRLAFELLLNLGPRQGDVIRLGPKHVKDGILRFQTQKTHVHVSIALSEDLQRAIEATPIFGECFITSPYSGRPFASVDAFYSWFRKAYLPLGITKPPHGLRKSAAERLANARATTTEMCAALGWKTSQMAEHYTKRMDREAIGIEASKKLQREINVPTP